MQLKDLNTKEYIFDPKSKDFEKRMISKSGVFDLPRDRKKWLTYITIVYDVNSEIRKNHPQYLDRKAEAALIAGFEKNTNSRFDPVVECGLLGNDEAINKAIIQFIYYSFSNDYKLLYVLSERYDEAIRAQSIPGVKFDDKDRKHLQAMKADIEELEEKIFGGTETINMKRALYEGIDNARSRMPRKEREMEKFEEDGLDAWAPFPNYRPDKLKYAGSKIPKQ